MSLPESVLDAELKEQRRIKDLQKMCDDTCYPYKKFRMRCEKFLTENGWALEPEATFNSEYTSFYKEGLVSVDINDSKIVLVGESGDFCHLPVDYYALIGALVEYRQIAVNYIPVKAV